MTRLLGDSVERVAAGSKTPFTLEPVVEKPWAVLSAIQFRQTDMRGAFLSENPRHQKRVVATRSRFRLTRTTERCTVSVVIRVLRYVRAL